MREFFRITLDFKLGRRYWRDIYSLGVTLESLNDINIFVEKKKRKEKRKNSLPRQLRIINGQ